MLYSLMKRVLSPIKPEQAHKIILQYLNPIIGTPLEWSVKQSVPTKTVNCMGISFKNPIGLAAGLDKNADYVDILDAIGFGFIEVGTITPRAQISKKQSRLFYLSKAGGIISNMDFNNFGVDHLVENVKKSHFSGILGISISKNQNTPMEEAKNDYLTCIEKIYPYAGYIAVNIFSNTVSEYTSFFYEILDDLLQAIKNKQTELQTLHKKYVPLVVKITPDINDQALIQVADSLVRHKIDGVIATSATNSRPFVQGLEHSTQFGCLSGRPLQSRSTEIIKKLSVELQEKIPIIGVGGVDSLIAAREKLSAGASLIQIYSAFIFYGPRLIKDIVNHI